MDWFKIDGKDWNVSVLSITETFTILYGDNTGRSSSVGAKMILNPLGTFYGYKVKVSRKQGFEKEFDNLFNFISKPRYDGLKVDIVHGQDVIQFDAYISTGERTLKKIDPSTKMVYWGDITLNIIPMEAYIKP